MPGPAAGARYDGEAMTIKNSVFDELKTNGSESRSVLYQSGTGTLLLENNAMAAATQSGLMAGGAQSQWKGSLPSLITARGNYATKPSNWWRES